MSNFAFILLLFELQESWQKLVPVDNMRVQLRAIYAGMFSTYFAIDVYWHHACTAHTEIGRAHV